MITTSFNPSHTETNFVQGTRPPKCSKLSKPCHVGIHLKALAEYYHMNTNMPGFLSFIGVFAMFYFEEISHLYQKD